jgi:uncharacterized protein (TIGR01777 family)
MKIVIAGGSGQIGNCLSRTLAAAGHEVVVLSRGAQSAATVRSVRWDGRTLGEWASEIDGSDAVVNLAGRSVNCRYTPENRRQIVESRTESTRVVGEAIARAARPPGVWLQAGTATIYADRRDAPNDEATGIIREHETDFPESWTFSVGVARAWERACEEARTPRTRRVILRTSLVMNPDPGSVFDVLLGLVRRGLGGAAGDGGQFISWIHHEDFVRAAEFLIRKDDIAGAVNLTSPGPVPNSDFMRELRRAWGARFGIPAPAGILAIGAVFLRTETELILKSRRVIPGRLLASGFEFKFPEWPGAARDLCADWRRIRSRRGESR